MTSRLTLVPFVLLLAHPAVRAEICPPNPPENPAARRALAESWFSKGEAAVNAGDELAAMQAFQCSLRLVPHGFTAYNLARIAERVGDLEMAITAYKHYLFLAPSANDREEVREKIDQLKARLAQSRGNDPVLEPSSISVAPAPTLPPAPEKQSEPVALATPPSPAPQESEGTRSRMLPAVNRTAALATVGGAIAMLGVGTYLNILARDALSQCHTFADAGQATESHQACDRARSRAYWSYGFFAAGGLAALAGVTFLVLPSSRDSTTSVGLLPEGGMYARLRHRF